MLVTTNCDEVIYFSKQSIVFLIPCPLTLEAQSTMFVTSNYDEVVRLRVAFPDNRGLRKRYEKEPSWTGCAWKKQLGLIGNHMWPLSYFARLGSVPRGIST